ncbi:hypothetical protein EBT16_01990, partial [bacterium]|nr:hypothetical protein [bacterium]
KESLADLAPTVKDQAPANWIVLGSLSAAQRKEIAALIAGPAFFIGGSLEEENTTAWEPMGPNSFWGKAADLGRGMGKIEWNSAPTGGSKSMFTSKGLRKDLDAGNQCSKIVNELFGSSQ